MFWDPKVHEVSVRVRDGERSALTKSATGLLALGADYVIERCEVAHAQREVLEALPADTIATIERLVNSPADIDALLALGRTLWHGTT